jgi:hypothetical protein
MLGRSRFERDSMKGRSPYLDLLALDEEIDQFNAEEYERQLDLFDWLTETYVLHA